MTKFLEGLKKDERGLTLIELLAVVVILAIVAAIAFVLIGNVIENSKKDAVVSDALQMISAAKLYEATGTSLEGGEVTLAQLQGTGDDSNDLIGEIYNPWDKKDLISDGSVSKENKVYTVVLDVDECKINHTEQVLIEKGRKVCDPTP